MSDEFKEAAEEMINCWKQHRDRWREDANIPRAIKCRLDALVEAMPNPKERVVFKAAALVRTYDARMHCDDALDALVAAVDAYKDDGIYKSYQASKRSPRCEPIPLETPNPRDELCEAAVALKESMGGIQIYSKDLDVRVPVIVEPWNRFVDAANAYKQSKGEG